MYDTSTYVEIGGFRLILIFYFKISLFLTARVCMHMCVHACVDCICMYMCVCECMRVRLRVCKYVCNYLSILNIKLLFNIILSFLQ